jgi:hypothetical protein
METTGMLLAVDVTRRHVLSARPDAPIVPDPPPRAAQAAPVRRAAAGALRRLADHVEPGTAEPAVG